LLTAELVTRGHTVRGTTRAPGTRELIEAAGAEAVIADPDRVVTLVPAFEHVAVVCILLGSVRGDASALHGTRLEMLLHKLLDTTVRGIVYEARGSAQPALLEAGAARVSAFCDDSRIPYALLRADPTLHDGWVPEAYDAVVGLLQPVGQN
jgi:uncharacterized protein YbjT (DUF2867 family)